VELPAVVGSSAPVHTGAPLPTTFIIINAAPVVVYPGRYRVSMWFEQLCLWEMIKDGHCVLCLQWLHVSVGII